MTDITRRAALLGASAALASLPGRGNTARADDLEDTSKWPGIGPAVLPTAWRWRRAQFRARAAEDRGATVFLGDSIIWKWESLPSDFPFLKTANRGLPGDTTRGVLARLKEDVLDLAPRATVVLIGTNDLSMRSSPDNVAANIRALLGELSNGQASPVILCKLMPRRLQPGLFPQRILETNAMLDALAKDRPLVSICDTFSPFATANSGPKPELYPDGLHPSSSVYAEWRNLLLPIFRSRGLVQT